MLVEWARRGMDQERATSLASFEFGFEKAGLFWRDIGKDKAASIILNNDIQVAVLARGTHAGEARSRVIVGVEQGLGDCV